MSYLKGDKIRKLVAPVVECVKDITGLNKVNSEIDSMEYEYKFTDDELKCFTSNKDIQIVTHSLDKIEVLYHQIESVYRGYRQCYSTKFDIKYNEDTMLALSVSAVDYYKSIVENAVDFVDEQHNKFRSKKYNYTDFLYMCNFIANHANHESQLEHAMFGCTISNISRVTSHQHVRSRIASHGQKSQRYTGEYNPTFIIPPDIEKDYQCKCIYMDAVLYTVYAANEIRKVNPNIKNEDIRYLYPQAINTSIFTSMNIRSWNHYFAERCCNRAQWEIRTVANQLLNKFKYYIPFIFANSGAKCIQLGYCPEEHSCGRMEKQCSQK